MADRIDYGLLETIASALRSVSSDIDSLADSLPSSPDAGNGTAAIVVILSKFAENAGNLVVGAAAAAEAVMSAKVAYQENDLMSADLITRTGIKAV
ncbi:hypothetical protein [Saccharomonospora xinjiangensis]|uniref:Excreted virulence factor EspC, type VII ESX diderm n=1 Tax=Saccharomonospora xinjiangensis XJ-54 TaxID=882086 RepID=I0UY06_9PSEU|nr:hypothetical protein [Saccharomonospora xinjiangensis]EID52759.1 hypothetical protein SacxiDRAFT_0483 [Saccharomonospora xinjiangensis XJ-54]